VVLRDGVPADDVTKEKILERLREYVAGYAIPREILFRDELPKTLVGKVAYRVLEEEAEAEEA
jgi:long-chain acyl-CoA synthetase